MSISVNLSYGENFTEDAIKKIEQIQEKLSEQEILNKDFDKESIGETKARFEIISYQISQLESIDKKLFIQNSDLEIRFLNLEKEYVNVINDYNVKFSNYLSAGDADLVDKKFFGDLKKLEMKYHETIEKLVSKKRIEDLLQYEKEKIKAYKEIARMTNDIIQESILNHLEVPKEHYSLILDRAVKEEKFELLPFVVEQIKDHYTDVEDKKKVDNYKQSILIQLRQLDTIAQEDDNTTLNDEAQKQKEMINKLVASLKDSLIPDKDVYDYKSNSNSKKSSYSKSDNTSDSSSSKSNNKGGNKPNDNGKGPQK